MVAYIIVAIAITAIILMVLRAVSKRIDLKDIDDNNRQYYNDEGDHIYYDRKWIKYKRSHPSDSNTTK